MESPILVFDHITGTTGIVGGPQDADDKKLSDVVEAQRKQALVASGASKPGS